MWSCIFRVFCIDIVNRDMVWKLGEVQSVYDELRFSVKTDSPCRNLLKFCILIFQQYGSVIRRCDAIGRYSLTLAPGAKMQMPRMQHIRYGANSCANVSSDLS